MDIRESGHNFNLELKEVAKFLEAVEAKELGRCYSRYLLEDDVHAPLKFYGLLERKMNIAPRALYPPTVKTISSLGRVIEYDLETDEFKDTTKPVKTRPPNAEDMGVIMIILSHNAKDPEVRHILSDSWETAFNKARSEGKI